ncbi:MAG: hypothetical protein V4543_00725 [Bacteroidota bacterium]
METTPSSNGINIIGTSNGPGQNGEQPRAKTTYKRIVVRISAAGKIISSNAGAFENGIKSIWGVSAFCNQNDDRIFNLSAKIEINGVEKTPADFDVRMMHAYSSVAVGTNRFLYLDNEPAGNRIIKITAVDSSEADDFAADGGAYDVTFMFLCLLD